jgi:hypothetical protein
MFDDQFVEENYAAVTRYEELSGAETAALDAAKRVTLLTGPDWLPGHYQWLDAQWRV